MAWIIGILTFILVVDCLFLGLLILVQLPKKEAGLGTAFGGGTADALFGAGTGNALTNMTKYSTVVFFILTLTLSMLRTQHTKAQQDSFPKAVENAEAPQPVAPATVPGPTNESGAAITNGPTASTNTPAPSTNNAPESPKPPEGTPPPPEE